MVWLVCKRWVWCFFILSTVLIRCLPWFSVLAFSGGNLLAVLAMLLLVIASHTFYIFLYFLCNLSVSQTVITVLSCDFMTPLYLYYIDSYWSIFVPLFDQAVHLFHWCCGAWLVMRSLWKPSDLFAAQIKVVTSNVMNRAFLFPQDLIGV